MSSSITFPHLTRPLVNAIASTSQLHPGRQPRRYLSTGPQSTTNYPDHVPLNFAQNALLAVGSGVVGVLDPTRGGASLSSTSLNSWPCSVFSVLSNSSFCRLTGILLIIDLIATLSESTASTFLPSLHASMISHPEGRQIMRDRPIVSSTTVDLNKLKSLKRGTLGREYVDWLERGNVTPDSREVVCPAIESFLQDSIPSHRLSKLPHCTDISSSWKQVRYIDSPTLAYTMLRYRQTHDLYHTLFSLPPTLPHELTLKVIELTNMSLPVAALSSVFGPFRMTYKRRDMWVHDWLPWALRMGNQGRNLVGVYWEKRWEQGVGELRRELGVGRNDDRFVEGRWRGYRELREREREARRLGDWIDEPEEW